MPRSTRARFEAAVGELPTEMHARLVQEERDAAIPTRRTVGRLMTLLGGWALASAAILAFALKAEQYGLLVIDDRLLAVVQRDGWLGAAAGAAVILTAWFFDR